ncbi:hypothetical protein ACEYYA_00840 [Paracoccus sp. p3-h83]|uniref:hypothetical protein n=1 Tax=Paracoccus sp. p3-h83 TaxID=3342805 RepID=UPI0035B82735
MTARRVTAADRLALHLAGWMAADGISGTDWGRAASILAESLPQAGLTGPLAWLSPVARDLLDCGYEARGAAVWRARRALADWHMQQAADLWEVVRADRAGAA